MKKLEFPFNEQDFQNILDLVCSDQLIALFVSDYVSGYGDGSKMSEYLDKMLRELLFRSEQWESDCDDHFRGVRIILDDFDHLGKLNNLEWILENNSKRGLPITLITRDFEAVEKRYGLEVSNRILDYCSTRILFLVII